VAPREVKSGAVWIIVVRAHPHYNGPMQRTLWLAGCLVALLTTCLAHADDKTAASAFARGTELFEKRDYIGALEAFEEAYRLKPHFMVQCNIARCYEESGDLVQSKTHYQRCLDEGGASNAEISKRARKALADVQGRIVRLTVASPGKGGTLHVDGRAAGKAPGDVLVNPGTHVVEVHREGASPASATITVRAGETRELSLIPADVPIEPTPTPPPSRGHRTLKQHWFWIATALTAAFGAATIGLGVSTIKARDSYLQSKTEDDYNAAVNRRMLTNVFVGLTAAAAGTATTLFFFTDFRRSASPERDSALTLGVGLQGRF
jgi:hypothetical protein